ncbi:MAG TPA: helicase-related protein, partial [Roseococcus sp.]|nr:helicase-related protein [Roseococcus sp.]
DTFRRRFAPLGIAVGGLSRLTPPAEARQLRADLADGTLKVVVGTQALLSRATRFARLGLVVVDEEQRFGARQKQALREVAQGEQAGVHVLAMTATPIPRSLQAALVGLQELSVIATAPARRQPIRTALAALEDGLLAEALRRERRRGGQSFVVVPRIEDMKEMRARIRAAAPRLSLVEAHGGMATAAADDAMIRFSEGRADVLLCTAIIETGLDVPRANTMLVCRAERFGLSQLHQLRGRVGRGGVRGAVWLLTDPRSPPPATTMKRLRALEALDRVGAGFGIAARDLDLPGAGDMLGEEQAGHVRMLGLPLTQHLLDRALRQARGEALAEAVSVVVKLGQPAHIPEGYVAEEALRLELHSRLGDLLRAGDGGALEDFAAELADRFGPPPGEVAALLDQARLRLRCGRLGVTRLEVGPAAAAASFAGAPPPALSPVEERNGRLVLRRNGGDAVSAAWALLDAITRQEARARAA